MLAPGKDIVFHGHFILCHLFKWDSLFLIMHICIGLHNMPDFGTGLRRAGMCVLELPYLFKYKTGLSFV